MSIPIPAGMEQAPVTWTLGHTTGTEALRGARGLVRFEPTAVAVAYPDVTVLPATVTARVSAGVMDPVDLTVNDPELWNWRVTPELGPAWPAFHIDVPVEGVDLATAVVVPGIGPIRAVTGPPGTTAWADLTGKPATYPPATHTHPVTDVDGLQAALPLTTEWEALGTLPGLTAGTCRFRWANGQPQLALASVEWAAGAMIPWTALPSDARIDTHARSSAVLTGTSNLTLQRTIIAYTGSIYMGQLASSEPMTGMITWTI